LSVQINKKHLIEAIQGLSRLQRKAVDLALHFENGHLILDLSGAQGRIEAKGEWQGVVFISLIWLLDVISDQKGKIIQLEYTEGVLRIGSSRCKAIWRKEVDLSATVLNPDRKSIEKFSAMNKATKLLGPYGVTFEDVAALVKKTEQNNATMNQRMFESKIRFPDRRL
jgi:hypothetical protein